MKHILVAMVVLVVALVSAHSCFAAKPTDAQITAAIDRGVQSLLDTQTDKGWWSPNGTYRSSNRDMDGAYEVCAMLALAYAEVSMNNEKMRKGFEELLKFDMKFTYTCSLRIMTISKLLPRLRRELRDRARKVMKKDALFLIRTQHDGQQDSGTWGYPNYARGATVEMVARIIERERPDGLLPTLGSQTYTTQPLPDYRTKEAA